MVQRASNSLRPKKGHFFVFYLNLAVAGCLALSDIFSELIKSKFPLHEYLHLLK